MKAILGFLLLLGLSSLSKADLESPSPLLISPTPSPGVNPSSPWRDEDAIRAWIVLTVQYAPPVGGKITVLKHWPPHYAKNDKVGELWVVPALVDVEMSANQKDKEMDFCVFHVDTAISEVEVSFQVPESEIQKYLHSDDGDKTGI